MSEAMNERMRSDAKLRTVALLHAADEDHRTMMISGEGWVCLSCDPDYGRMVAWAVEAGKAMWEAGPRIEVFHDGARCSATGELFQPNETDDVWWDRGLFDHMREWYPDAVYVGVDGLLFTEDPPCRCESSVCDHGDGPCFRSSELADTKMLGSVCGTCRANYATAGYPLALVDDAPEPAEEEVVSPLTSVEFMEYLCEDSGMCGSQIADVSDAKEAGWLVEAGTALIETGDGRRFLVRVSEVTGR